MISETFSLVANNRGKTKGTRAELLFEIFCLENGWECSKPILDTLPYDYVVIGIESSFKKVQVKSVFLDSRTSRYRCDIRKSKPNSRDKQKYSDGDFDYLAINFDGIGWALYPWEKIKNRSQISIAKSEIESHNGLQLLRQKL